MKSDEVKEFDCVEMKRIGSALVYEKIKNMSVEEELAFWDAESKKMKELQQKYKIH